MVEVKDPRKQGFEKPGQSVLQAFSVYGTEGFCSFLQNLRSTNRLSQRTSVAEMKHSLPVITVRHGDFSIFQCLLNVGLRLEKLLALGHARQP